MASNIKYPEDKSLYFIRGDHLGLVTTHDSTNASRTDRKAYQAFDHAVTNGLLLHYYGNPLKVVSITDTPDIDNLFHGAIVDYVKKCLYMDRAGASQDAGSSQVSMALMAEHQKRFDLAVKKYGTRKRTKVGGSRAVAVPDFK